MPSSDKFQRWIDLMAALLVRNHPVTFDELVADVPEYAVKRREIRAANPAQRDTLEESLKRTFERDKQELKTFGVPLESLPDTRGNAAGMYRLQRKHFYLPYLCVALPGQPAPTVKRVDKYGYQALATLSFEPEELRAVVDAAALVRSLGDPLLAADARCALRKLAVDLPVDAIAVDDPGPGRPAAAGAPAVGGADVPHVVLPRARAKNEVFERLSDALRRRKQVTFLYHTFSDDQVAARTVEPYGLFFLHGHWYLVARDTALGELRNFRLNRLRDVTVSSARSLSPDYDIAPSFRLRDHAASKQAWELGDDDVLSVVVAFTGTSGPTLAAARLGAEVADEPHHRVFAVRRVEPFVRWALAFAGEVDIVRPPVVVTRYCDEAAATRAQYQGDPPPHDDASVRRPASRPSSAGSSHWQPKGAAAQLQRILQVIPHLADGDDHTIADVARRADTDAATVYADLKSLVDRFELPAGHIEGVQLYLESERVSVVSNHFLRPMRLTVSELCALELGLVMLRAQRPPHEHEMLGHARTRLRAVIARLAGDPIPDSVHHASIGESGSIETLGVFREAVARSRTVRLAYRKSGSSTADVREVCPFALVASSGMLYVVAHCLREDGLRLFRLDRVESAELLDGTFERPADFEVDDVVADGRAFQGEAPETLIVRFSPRIARWIAEREGVDAAADGSLTMAYPLADPAWAMRFVLQYGAEAEVLEPVSMREAIRARLNAVLLQTDATRLPSPVS